MGSDPDPDSDSGLSFSPDADPDLSSSLCVGPDSDPDPEDLRRRMKAIAAAAAVRMDAAAM